MVEAAHIEPYKLVEDAMVRASVLAHQRRSLTTCIQAAGESKHSMVRSLIEEYTAKGSIAEEKRDIMSAAAMSYLGKDAPRLS